MRAQGFASALSERVSIERWAAASDESAGDPGRWVVEQSGWADIRIDRMRPADDGAALSTRQRYRIAMRDDPGIGLQHRLVWQGVVLTLLAVERDPGSPDRMTMVAEARR